MTTTNLQLAEITESQANKYATHNNALVELDDIIAGTLVKELTSDADYTLLTTGSPAEWQRAVIKITDTTPNLTADRNIIVPNNEKVYIAWNATSTYNLTFKTAAGSGVTVAPGDAVLVFSDGTNVNPGNSHPAIVTLASLLMSGNIDLDGNDLIIDADGDSYLHENGDDNIELFVGGSLMATFTTTSADLAGNLTASGQCAIGGAISSNDQFILDGTHTGISVLTINTNVTGIGSGRVHQFGVYGDSIGVSGNTDLFGAYIFGKCITQGASETLNDVAQLCLLKPTITLNTGDTITNASTLLITGAPTEGANNYAILVDNGDSSFGGDIFSTGGLVGYGTGSGGTVTQATSRTTGVTLNKSNGSITLVSAAGSATYQTFTVTNSTVSATDTIILSQQSGTDLNMLHVTNVGAGSFDVTFATTGGTTTEQPVFNFAVIKGVNA